ncbi:MAG TPA: protein translocase subunit SecF [Candidatus Deferrimicrobium sp.]|nr:protein translocase subunit SecF [Candidatus Deferrimicrobium sp.]
MTFRERILRWDIVGRTRTWFTASSIIIAIGIVAMIINTFSFGSPLKFGIDFIGGTLINASFEKAPDEAVVRDILSANGYSNVTVQRAGAKGITMKVEASEIDPAVSGKIISDIVAKYGAVDAGTEEITSIAPVIGRELLRRSSLALALSLLFTLLYITIRFKFSFGLATILGMVHDILVALGILAVFRVPLNAPFVGAFLAIITYSVQDGVVVMDRIREKLRYRAKEPFDKLANAAVTETWMRSFNTSFTTFLAVLVLFIMGGAPIRDFSTTLLVGIISGTYSSIYISTPLLVLWVQGREKAAALQKA